MFQDFEVKTEFSKQEYSSINRKDLMQELTRYAKPNNSKAMIQVCNTFIPYLVLFSLMIYCVVQEFSVWITLSLSIVAAAFLVRLFVLFHDCCHSAFFPGKLANRLFGYITGVLTFTPFEDWQRAHIIHHGSSGDLDNRGQGDVWTLTVAEYLAAPFYKRMAYRVFRNPIILFSVTPMVLFLVVHRFSSPGAKKREKLSVFFTNLGIVVMMLILSLTLGFQNYLLIQLPTLVVASSIGTWLFYVQHQYDGTYWERNADWDLTSSGLEGSSNYQLPPVLQWIGADIGLHHIHHVRANIPNYNLQRCYKEIPILQTVPVLTLRKSLDSLWLNLWDEEKKQLVSFCALRNKPRIKG